MTKTLLEQEIETNFESFNQRWRQELATVSSSLAAKRDVYLSSYFRLVSLQAWRESFLKDKISKDSLAFFVEAQNDALSSHCLANLGAWGLALKSLRSCLENVLFCLYYKDHPVELELWKAGKHRLGFRNSLDYFASHPLVGDVNAKLDILTIIEQEYSTLSRAVHGEAPFRMTGTTEAPLIFQDSIPSQGKWATREKSVILGVNLLLLAVFRLSLSGTAFPGLRQSVSFSIPTATRAKVKSFLGITLD